jgi:hypothetical protein
MQHQALLHCPYLLVKLQLLLVLQRLAKQQRCPPRQERMSLQQDPLTRRTAFSSASFREGRGGRFLPAPPLAGADGSGARMASAGTATCGSQQQVAQAQPQAKVAAGPLRMGGRSHREPKHGYTQSHQSVRQRASQCKGDSSPPEACRWLSVPCPWAALPPHSTLSNRQIAS